MFRKALVMMLVVAAVASCVSCGHNGSHFVYVTVPAVDQLAVFREDPYSGVLTQLSESPYTIGSGPSSVVAHPSGKYLYVANAGLTENDVSLFDVNSDGTVSEVTPRTPTGTLPLILAMDPGGNFLYVANVNSNSLSVFSIDASSGSLSAISGSPFSLGLSPKSMQISSSGQFLYISAPALQSSGFIAAYSLSSGVPTRVGLTTTADGGIAGIAIDPTGSYLYAANSTTGNSISIYCIVPASSCSSGTAGTLQQVAGSPLSSGFSSPVALTLDPKGDSLFVANEGSNKISTFSITSGTGFPNPVTDSPFASETEPSFLVMDSNGKYLFVGSQGSGAGIQAFGNSAGSLNSIATYGVGNTVSSLAIVQ
jgi:6-phosphogluconolactonase